jgi:hypothetical protein
MAADNVNVIAFVRGLHNDAQGYSQTQRLAEEMCISDYVQRIWLDSCKNGVTFIIHLLTLKHIFQIISKNISGIYYKLFLSLAWLLNYIY